MHYFWPTAFLPAVKLSGLAASGWFAGVFWLLRSRPWRGPPGSRACCWGSPAPSVLPRRALLCSALCPGVQACLARGRGVRPFCALAVRLAVRLCRLLLTCGFGHVCFCAVAHWGRGACSCFPHLAPCHLVLSFAFGRSLRSPWWPILPLSGLSVCFSSRLFRKAPVPCVCMPVTWR